jgi:microcystin-dependent protein
MKKQITLPLFVAFFLFAQLVNAQYSSQGFSFQGYAIDGDNKALASTGITVQFTIYRTGTSYVEEHTTTTDAFGVFSAAIGEGTASSAITFGELDFNNFDFSLKVEVKETSGGTYTTISDKLLGAVPYARSASNGVPVGTIVAFAGPATAVPDGWLLCDGAALNSSSNLAYAQLFNVIGTTWGGTGNTSFNIPDLRGAFIRGLNETAGGLDPNRTLGSYQGGEIQSHNHTAWSDPVGDHTHGISAYASNTASDLALPGRATNSGVTPSSLGTDWAGGHSHGIGVNYSGGTETRPANWAVNYIIKY